MFEEANMRWFMSVILETQEAEIRIAVRGQPKQKVSRSPSQPIGRCSGLHL
jgi:hypothetical protein